MAEKLDFFDRVQGLTEAYLTRKRWIRRLKKEKQRKKNPLLDWIEAFLWAAGMVLLINQYLLQAYQIPSGSMIDTLLIGDRVFVNKIVYGPELLPGLGKLPSPIKPKRNDIIIFENPSYISRGPVFDIVQRIIYMLTLSFVDIDRDEAGEPKAHFLIKRAVGVAGDRFTIDKGEFRIRFAGEDRWVTEREYAAARNLNYHISRLIEPQDYPALAAAGKLTAYANLGLAPPESLVSAGTARSWSYPDYLFHEQARLELLRAARPEDGRYGLALARYTQGWYVPEGRIFPLGDNRDNSRDGRYFNPVRLSKVLGKGSVIYWPLPRIGLIR
ncbi:MAG: signal peptidase I [Spirochaetaceae bacterium]|jgi:signal peptidase I|nr:signal peptidase I [Spirochaetaceae bacterium]